MGAAEARPAPRRPSRRCWRAWVASKALITKAIAATTAGLHARRKRCTTS